MVMHVLASVDDARLDPGTTLNAKLPQTDKDDRTIGGFRLRESAQFRGLRCDRCQEARRRAASHALRSLRRSSSEVAPQTPDSWLVARAKSRQVSWTSQAPAHPLGRLDLVDGGPGGPDGEEQIGLGAPAGRELPPVTFVPLDRAIPHEGHADSSTHQSELPSCDLFHIARR